MFHMPSGTELLLLVGVVVLLFGAKKIPEVMRGLGTGMKEFKRATSEASEEFHKITSLEPTPAPQATVAAAEPQPVEKPA